MLLCMFFRGAVLHVELFLARVFVWGDALARETQCATATSRTSRGKATDMSWGSSAGWNWSEDWTGPAMGKGKGKKGGKKGKSKYPGQPEEETWGQSAVTEHLGRIRSQYQLPHKLLKASADADGSALVKATKMADDAFLSHKNLKRLLSTENTHLLRRPGVGLSEAAGSIQAGAATLEAVKELDLRPLAQVLAKTEVQKALAVLNTTDPSVTERGAGVLAEAIDALCQEFAKAEDLEEQAIKCTIFASRTYLLGTHLLALLTCLQDPAWWAEQIPENISENKKLHAWKAGSNRKMSQALAALVVEKLETAAQYTTNDAASIFGRKSAPARKTQSSGSESEKKAKKTRKKEEKKRRKKATSSSSASEKKKTKKEKKPKDKKKKHEKEEEKTISSNSSASEKKKAPKDKDPKDKEKKADKEEEKKRRRSEESEVEAKESKELKKDQKRRKAQQEEQEKKEAAYTAWELGQLQVFLAAVEEQHGNMANLREARFPVQELKDFVAQIPDVLQVYGPAVPDTEEEHIPAAEAKSVVGDMVRLAKDAEKFLTQESRKSAGGSS